jgi:hypothetical protein
MDWIALKHALLSHLPVAAGLLLPWALLAAQRRGRGIRPWWTVSRYLGWMGLAGLLGALVSGLASARLQGLIPAHRTLPLPVWGTGNEALLFRHALLGVASLALSAGALWSMNRPRRDHESLGFLALFFGLAWSAALLLAGQNGYRLAHERTRASIPAIATPVPVPAPALPTRPGPDPEAQAPLRALDYASLEPLHPDAVKSMPHGGRWIRAWATPEAASAYRSGRALPQGGWVVLSSTEDRWGRPGPDPGPLWAMEMKASGPVFLFYWPRIPMERRRDFGGESRAYWREGDAHLEACRACHAKGYVEAAQRSRWRPKRLTPEP